MRNLFISNIVAAHYFVNTLGLKTRGVFSWVIWVAAASYGEQLQENFSQWFTLWIGWKR